LGLWDANLNHTGPINHEVFETITTQSLHSAGGKVTVPSTSRSSVWTACKCNTNGRSCVTHQAFISCHTEPWHTTPRIVEKYRAIKVLPDLVVGGWQVIQHCFPEQQHVTEPSGVGSQQDHALLALPHSTCRCHRLLQ
jgi:hypothetical protein